MLISPYGAVICAHYQDSKLHYALERASITDPLPAMTTPVGNVLSNVSVITPVDAYSDVPAFTQCFPMTKGSDGITRWVVDGRPFMRWETRNDSYRLVAENDYAFQCTRAALTEQLSNDYEHAQAFYHQLGDLPARVFTRWVSSAISRRFNLSLQQQITLNTIVTYYYYSQLVESRRLSEQEVILRAKFVARVNFTTAASVLEVGEKLPPLTDANALVKAITTHTDTVRLSDFKFADLFTLLANSWFGVNARETVGVALEHMPTFVAMMYAAIDERSYRKTVIAERVESSGKQADAKQFANRVYAQVSSRFTRG